LQNKKRIFAKILSVLIALLVWQIVSMCLPKLLFASPVQTAKSLFRLMGEWDFYLTVWFSLSRILLGFLSALALGIGLAVAAGRFRIAETLLWPYIITVKSVPLASFVAIAFLWVDYSGIGVLISFLMALPIVYNNLLAGIKATDGKMLEMADVFNIPFRRRLRYIWLPATKNYLFSGVRISFGLAWKAGIAAELLAQHNGTIGEAIFSAKQFLETADLFAWTFVIIVVSFIVEKLLLFLLKRLFKGVEK